MKWEGTWKCFVTDHGNSWAWEEVYQAFKERLEKEKTLEPECKHGETILGDWFGYKNMGNKHCRDCGEKL